MNPTTSKREAIYGVIEELCGNDFKKVKLQYINPAPFKARNINFDLHGIERIYVKPKLKSADYFCNKSIDSF